ncbi:MAG: DNA translocase FtsK [Bdellovibrionales bacterium]|nr:DNA translocase FtsK [Bdellovibrionales bacterium]
MTKKPTHGRVSAPQKSVSVEIGSILVFAFAIFALTALATYHPADPSFFTATNAKVANACGRVGAYLASGFFECFGIAAFLIPAALFFIAASIYRREGGLRVLGTLSGMTVAVLSLTVFLTLQWRYVPYAGVDLLTGGAFGVWFAEILSRQFNSAGASMVSAAVFLVSVALSTPISIAASGGKILGVAKLFFTRVLLRIARVIVTYAAFLLGLLAMKTAQASARGMEKMIESLLDRARAAREAYDRKREEMKAARAAAASATRPQIGNGSETESEDEAETVELAKAGAAGLPAVEVVGNVLGGASVPEAKNVLTDPISISALKEASSSAVVGTALTNGGATATLASSMTLDTSSRPAILPHEMQKQTGFEGLSPGVIAEIQAAEAARKPKKKAPTRRGSWKLPQIDYLVKPPKIETQVDKDRLYRNSEILTQKFLDFEIEGEVTAVRPGPVITLYEFKPAPGVKVSRIASLADDISMALSAQSVRIIAPLPGKNVVGIEIPSDVRENVFMREFFAHADFQSQTKHAIPVAMGKDIAGNIYLADLAKMPHLLCAGQTGSGKSVFMNGLICSLLYRFTPDELRMILVDPKMIEFSSYQDVPHLLLPVVDDCSHAASALKWAVREMERRYRILAMMNARNLASYNQKVDEIGVELLQETLERAESEVEGMERMSGGDWVESFDKDEDGDPRYGKLPYVVIFIDELAELMMTAKKEVELSIARIAQKARAAGIHLVVATQRPSTDVVTGLIKANLPSRVSFALASGFDSKTILDRFGAEKLLGRGDMFFIPPGQSNLLRLHGAYLADDEINKITSFLKAQGKPTYRNEILQDEDAEGEDGEGGESADPVFDQAVELAKKHGQVSASFLQRHLRVGYNRAARLVETMEAKGIVGPADGARPREVLVR